MIHCEIVAIRLCAQRAAQRHADPIWASPSPSGAIHRGQHQRGGHPRRLRLPRQSRARHGAIVWLSGLAASSLHLTPAGETAAVEQVQHLDDSVIVGLVKGYKNRFHYLNLVFSSKFLVLSRITEN